MSLHPTNLQIVEPDELQIQWSDGQVRRYPFRELRDQCPCATCREKTLDMSEAPAEPLQLNVLSAAEAQPLSIKAMKPVGNYAYTIVFQDGHDTGIYSFELLRELGRTIEASEH